MQVRDWYVDSFRELRSFPEIKDAETEIQFTDLLKSIYQRHRNVVPVMAMGVAELKEELSYGEPLSTCFSAGPTKCIAVSGLASGLWWPAMIPWFGRQGLQVSKTCFLGRRLPPFLSPPGEGGALRTAGIGIGLHDQSVDE